MVRKRNLWIRAAWCLVLIPLVVCLNHAAAAVSPPKAKPAPEAIYVLVGPASPVPQARTVIMNQHPTWTVAVDKWR